MDATTGPTYDLLLVQQLVRQCRRSLRIDPARHAARLELDEEDIWAVLLELTVEEHFDKTMPSDSSGHSDEMLDVYKITYGKQRLELYVKLKLENEGWVHVLSFKEDSSR